MKLTHILLVFAYTSYTTVTGGASEIIRAGDLRKETQKCIDTILPDTFIFKLLSSFISELQRQVLNKTDDNKCKGKAPEIDSTLVAHTEENERE